MAFVLLSSCQDTFLDPFENDERFYSVYGFLDPLEEIQKVRVIPVTRFPEDIVNAADPQAFLDAKVQLRDLTIPRIYEWWPLLEEDKDGSFVHTFSDTMIVEAGHTYQLEILRSDGILTTAKTTVPRVRTDQLLLKSLPVVLSDSSVIQQIGIPEIPALWDMQVVYLVEGSEFRERVFVAYDKNLLSSHDDQWRYNLQLTSDQDSIKAYAQKTLNATGQLGDSISLTGMGVQFRIIDDQWFPIFAEQDMVKLAQPGAFSNVENGYGVFGSMGLYQEEWEISSELAELLGYPLTVEVN